ncbi:MAG: hypothetical protein HZB23_02970 [Deltaproteobacteria bacterium]|nr:hypothetical protein [Deltaproteobacteria bacterium]
MPKDKGTVIRIHMTLHPITYILLVPIVGLLSIFSLALIASGFDDATWGMLGVLGGMFCFLLAMMYGGFFIEAGKSKKLLAELLSEVDKEFETKKPQSDG